MSGDTFSDLKRHINDLHGSSKIHSRRLEATIFFTHKS